MDWKSDFICKSEGVGCWTGIYDGKLSIKDKMIEILSSPDSIKRIVMVGKGDASEGNVGFVIQSDLEELKLVSELSQTICQIEGAKRVTIIMPWKSDFKNLMAVIIMRNIGRIISCQRFGSWNMYETEYGVTNDTRDVNGFISPQRLVGMTKDKNSKGRDILVMRDKDFLLRASYTNDPKPIITESLDAIRETRELDPQATPKKLIIRLLVDKTIGVLRIEEFVNSCHTCGHELVEMEYQ